MRSFLHVVSCALAVVLGLAGPVVGAGTPLDAETADGFVEVVLVVEGASVGEGRGAAPVKGHLLWSSAASKDPVSVLVDGPGLYRLPLGARDGGGATLGTVTAEVAGFWAAPAVVSTVGGEAKVVLLPTGTVEAGVKVPEGAELPGELELEFGPASFLQARDPSPVARAAGGVRCPVEEGRLRCEVPGGLHDLRWHAPGFATVMRWKVAVPVRDTVRVPDLELVPGGSILGFVEITEDAPPPVEGERRTAVGLSVAALETGRHDTQRRLDYLAQEVELGPDGSFQFQGLAPGSYRITASGEGLAPDRQPVVEVLEGQESQLSTAIRLEPEVVQEVRVQPPTTPDGRPWQVYLFDARGIGAGLCTTGPSGDCRMPPLAAGEYRLRVRDTTETTWHERLVDLHRNAPPLEVELPLVPVAGTLTRNDEPVRARLIFHRGRGRERVETYTDFDGRFTGVVPGEGEWFVAANLESRGVELGLGTVDVARPADGEPFELDLEIPETQLVGTVVDATGRPVAARLFLRPDSEGEDSAALGSEGWTDAEGRFRVWGLAEGRWRVSAVGAGRSATSDPVELREGEVARVEVRLPGQRELRGRVLSNGRPVAGAQVELWPDLETHNRVGVAVRALSGPDGSFEVLLPQNTVAADGLILAAGYAARVVRIGRIGNEVLEIHLDSWGGTLELREGGGVGPGHRLAHGTVDLSLGLFLQWPSLFGLPARLGGPVYTLPQMAPGPYRFCTPDHGRCAEGELTAGGHLVLDLGGGEDEGEGGAGETTG